MNSLPRVCALIVVEAEPPYQTGLKCFACKRRGLILIQRLLSGKSAALLDTVVVLVDKETSDHEGLLRAQSRIKDQVKRRLNLVDAFVESLAVNGSDGALDFLPQTGSRLLDRLIDWQSFTQEPLHSDKAQDGDREQRFAVFGPVFPELLHDVLRMDDECIGHPGQEGGSDELDLVLSRRRFLHVCFRQQLSCFSPHLIEPAFHLRFVVL